LASDNTDTRALDNLEEGRCLHASCCTTCLVVQQHMWVMWVMGAASVSAGADCSSSSVCFLFWLPSIVRHLRGPELADQLFFCTLCLRLRMLTLLTLTLLTQSLLASSWGNLYPVPAGLWALCLLFGAPDCEDDKVIAQQLYHAVMGRSYLTPSGAECTGCSQRAKVKVSVDQICIQVCSWASCNPASLNPDQRWQPVHCVCALAV
jgi:hypothetical protein